MHATVDKSGRLNKNSFSSRIGEREFMFRVAISMIVYVAKKDKTFLSNLSFQDEVKTIFPVLRLKAGMDLLFVKRGDKKAKDDTLVASSAQFVSNTGNCFLYYNQADKNITVTSGETPCLRDHTYYKINAKQPLPHVDHIKQILIKDLNTTPTITMAGYEGKLAPKVTGVILEQMHLPVNSQKSAFKSKFAASKFAISEAARELQQSTQAATSYTVSKIKRALLPQQGGTLFIKTEERVMIGNRKRIVYKGHKNVKYILVKGVHVPLSKVRV